MATRTIIERVEQTQVLKLSWKEIERERREYPCELFTVHALMQSDGEMLGYVIKDGNYYCCYVGDQNFAMTANITVSDTLVRAQKKLMDSFADKD